MREEYEIERGLRGDCAPARGAGVARFTLASGVIVGLFLAALWFIFSAILA
jgi:hypothetical protein